MDKQWISQIANDIESKYGKETRDKIIGAIDSVQDEPQSLLEWFNNFTTGMDELDDKDFLRRMMANRCPCGDDFEKDGKAMRDIYDQSNTLEEFVNANREWLFNKYGDTDIMELRGNILYLTKPFGGHEITGSCGKGCHCWLAKNTNNPVSDIFCHCCTIGHTGRPFKVAFGEDIKMEFVESIICGGRACVMTVHLPEKQ